MVRPAAIEGVLTRGAEGGRARVSHGVRPPLLRRAARRRERGRGVNSMSPTAVGITTAVLVALSTSALAAHDFWLVPDAFAVTPGGRISARGQTSSLFPTSLSAVTPDRIVETRVLTAGADVSVADIGVRQQSLVLGYRPTTTGQHVIGVRIAPRTLRESPASFRRYLDLEGAPEARLRYEQEGLLAAVGGDSISRRYAKYAKSFVEVGMGARAFSRTLGHPLELVPLTDPANVRVGDTLRFRLLLLGTAAPLAHLHAGSAPPGAVTTDTAAARRWAASDVSVQTDSAGVVSVVVTRAGVWNVRTLQIVRAVKGSGADWDVHWATIVFQVLRH